MIRVGVSLMPSIGGWEEPERVFGDPPVNPGLLKELRCRHKRMGGFVIARILLRLAFRAKFAVELLPGGAVPHLVVLLSQAGKAEPEEAVGRFPSGYI